MNAALEYNDKGCLLFSLDCPGAFARGATEGEVLSKLPADVESFCRWAGLTPPEGPVTVTQRKFQPGLNIADADSDILLAGEELPLTAEEYASLRELVLRSAKGLDELYAAVPDPDYPLAPPRDTFYGTYPNTAREMVEHTNRVTAYYVGEMGADYENAGNCYENRLAGLAAFEALPSFLTLPVCEGSYGEDWSPRKMLRRFLWHDRIHARALWRRARTVWGDVIPDPFGFSAP